MANLFVASNINESVAAEFERILYQHLDPPFNAELPTQVYGTPVYHVDEKRSRPAISAGVSPALVTLHDLTYTSSHVCLTDWSARRSSGLPSNTMRPCPMT